jgi:hypothetical protein
MAAELRLWDAIDKQRLVPFAYYGIGDNTDLRQIPWRRGRGYDTNALSQLLTADDAWARMVIEQLTRKVDRVAKMLNALFKQPKQFQQFSSNLRMRPQQLSTQRY